jgi:hypothetical protein
MAKDSRGHPRAFPLSATPFCKLRIARRLGEIKRTIFAPDSGGTARTILASKVAFLDMAR